MIDNNHFHNHIYPLLRHDLEHHTKVISIDKWVEFILGVPPSKLSYWRTYLRDEHLLVDFVITKNMESYCTAQVDRDRHGPWATIVNRIFSISRKYIQTLGQSPLPDLFFVPNNSAIIIEGRPPYAQPDILVVSRPTLPKLPHNSAFNEDASGITWNHIISCAQFRTGVEHTLLEVYSNWQSSVAPAGKSISPYQKRKRRVAGVSKRSLNTILFAHYSAS